MTAGLRAGMTVWGVNAAVAAEGVHRHFTSLREAVPHILALVSARGRAEGSARGRADGSSWDRADGSARRQAVGSSGSGSSLPDAGRDRGASP